MTRTIVLTDGEHTLSPPTMGVLITLQEMGYPLIGEGGVFFGALVKGDEPNLIGIRDHLYAFMVDAGEDPDLADIGRRLVLENLAAYVNTIRDLYAEAFGGEDDPKASDEGSPE